MDWFRVNVDLPSHPKARALARELGETVSWWRIAQVWAWCVRYHRDGQITGLDCHVDIEEAAGWTGDPGAFVRAAVRVGFLIEVENGYAVHDWMKHNGKAIKQSERINEKMRKWRKGQKKSAKPRYGNATVTLPITQDRNVTDGRDGTGRDVTTDQKPLSAIADAADGPAEVFRHWQQVMGHPRATFDDKRRAAVEKQIKAGKTVADLKRAIDGCKVTPHNQGQNNRGEVYDDLGLICRDAAQVERFMRNAEKPPMTTGRDLANHAANEYELAPTGKAVT